MCAPVPSCTYVVCTHWHTLLFLLNKKIAFKPNGLLFQHSMKWIVCVLLTVSTDLNVQESNKWILRITHISKTREQVVYHLKHRDSCQNVFSIYSIFTVFLINSCGSQILPSSLAHLISNKSVVWCVFYNVVVKTEYLLSYKSFSVKHAFS